MKGILETAELYVRLRQELLKGHQPVESLKHFDLQEPNRWQITTENERVVMRDSLEPYSIDWTFP